MFRIKKTFEVAIAHRLDLSYESKCSNFHGHNLIITVYCACENDVLDENGMVVDFTHIKKQIQDRLDHKSLTNVDCPSCGYHVIPSAVDQLECPALGKNPTAERLAHWIYMQIDKCYRVDVQESEGNIATYEVD